MNSTVGIVWALAWKDLVVEYRNREIVVSIVIFSLLVLAIFTFAIELTNQSAPIVGPGVLWAGIAFAGITGLNHSFSQERERDTLEGLMLAPVSRDLIFLGKALGNFLFMLLSVSVVLPVFTVLFNLNLLRLEILAITLLTTFGLSIVGTLFAAMTVKSRAREILLPMLFLPSAAPLLIAAVEATAGIVTGSSWLASQQWLGLAAAFDILFLVISVSLFGHVLED